MPATSNRITGPQMIQLLELVYLAFLIAGSQTVTTHWPCSSESILTLGNLELGLFQSHEQVYRKWSVWQRSGTACPAELVHRGKTNVMLGWEELKELDSVQGPRSRLQWGCTPWSACKSWLPPPFLLFSVGKSPWGGALVLPTASPENAVSSSSCHFCDRRVIKLHKHCCCRISWGGFLTITLWSGHYHPDFTGGEICSRE